MWAKVFTTSKVYVGRGDFGDDLLDSLTKFCEENKITAGIISAIGALQTLNVSYYLQDKKRYIDVPNLNQSAPFELLSCMGNVSLKDGKPFVHAHLVAGDKDGKAYGGHLIKGCKIFALEFSITSLQGDNLVRQFDETLQLNLWAK
jgi:predicted DNA-binding protein with PD1-like motif